MKYTRFRSPRLVYGNVGFLHAEKDGGPVLRGEASWRTVNGFFINSRRTGMVLIEFRRYLR